MDVAYVIIICSAVFVINTYQSDDKDNANILVNSLPYTRKEIISSKYVGTLLFTIVIIPFCLVGKYFILDSMEFQLSIESYILGFGSHADNSILHPIFVAFKVKTLVPVFIFLSIGVIYLMRNTPYLLNKYANGVLTFLKEISDLKLFLLFAVIAVGAMGFHGYYLFVSIRTRLFNSKF